MTAGFDYRVEREGGRLALPLMINGVLPTGGLLMTIVCSRTAVCVHAVRSAMQLPGAAAQEPGAAAQQALRTSLGGAARTRRSGLLVRCCPRPFQPPSPAFGRAHGRECRCHTHAPWI